MMLCQVARTNLLRNLQPGHRSIQRLVVTVSNTAVALTSSSHRNFKSFECQRRQIHSHRQILHFPSTSARSLTKIAIRWKSDSLASRVVATAPSGLQPYLKLTRMDKPVGKACASTYVKKKDIVLNPISISFTFS